jgi:DNA-binding transcriptional ArsR family regulator
MATNPNTTSLQETLIEYIRSHGPKTSNELATALGVSARAVSNSLSSARGAGLVTDGIVCWQMIEPDGSHNDIIHTSRPSGPVVWYLEITGGPEHSFNAIPATVQT